MNAVVMHVRSSAGLYGAEQAILGMCRAGESASPNACLTVLLGAGGGGRELVDAARHQGIAVDALACRGRFDPSCIAKLRRRIARAGNARTIVHCHDYKSIVYVAIASIGLDVIRIATLHGWTGGGGRLRLYHALEALALGRFHRVCAVSSNIAEALANRGIDRGRIARVTNGIDTDRYRPLEGLATRRTEAPLRLGTAARLAAEKNLSGLIRAVAECNRRGRPTSLELCGDGPLRDELADLIRALALEDHVRLKGRIEHPEDWYPDLDAMVLPSLTEGLPLALLEALACGCPVVATDVGEVAAVLEGLPGCRIVPAGDDDALVDALLALRARRRPDDAAVERIRGRYSLRHMAESYAEIYREALAA